MHNAGLPDLARENAEYIITNCKGVFPFELATGQDQHVPVKKEHDGNQQDQHQKRGAWEEGDAKMEDQGGQEELSDDVKRALQELKSLQAQSIVKPSEAKAKERPPTITGKLIEAQPELKPLTERWIDKETFMEKYKTHICVVVNRDKETRGSMFNPYAGLQIKYRLLLQGEKKWGKWTCEPVDPNRESPGGPPALPFATFKAYFAPKEDIPFEEAKEELTKLVWAIKNEENEYRTRQPALEQNITVIDNNAKPQSDPVQDGKHWIVKISYPLTRTFLVTPEKHESQSHVSRGPYVRSGGRDQRNRGDYRTGSSSRGKHKLLMKRQMYSKNRDPNTIKEQHPYPELYNITSYNDYVMPSCYLPGHSRLTQIHLNQEGNSPMNHGITMTVTRCLPQGINNCPQQPWLAVLIQIFINYYYQYYSSP